jgi:hypothetical protein
MTSPSEVIWSADALEAWHHLPMADAEAIARAVQRFADVGEGLVIYVDGEYRIFVGARVASMLIDGATIHVIRIRRA